MKGKQMLMENILNYIKKCLKGLQSGKGKF